MGRWLSAQIRGRSPGPLTVSIFVVVMTSLCFAIVLPYIPLFLPLSVALCCCSFLTIVFLWVAFWTEPGIILPRWAMDRADVERHDMVYFGGLKPIPIIRGRLAGERGAGGGRGEGGERGAGGDQPPPPYTQIYDRVDVKGARWCFTCGIFRPLDAHHCSLCGHCVGHFDHHCGAVGNCIGARNHRYFLGLLFFGASASCIALASTALRLHQLVGARAFSAGFVFALLLSFLLACVSLQLTGFWASSCGIAVSGRTTKTLMVGGEQRAAGATGRSFFRLCCLPDRWATSEDRVGLDSMRNEEVVPERYALPDGFLGESPQVVQGKREPGPRAEAHQLQRDSRMPDERDSFLVV